MARWQKSSPDLVARFHEALPDDPQVERRSMFGYPAAFVGGNMFAGLHEERCMLRLGDAERTTLLAEPGAKPFEPMPGRVMREYVVVPSRLVAERGPLVRWLAEAFRYARALPPKKKPPAVRTPRTGVAPRASKSATPRSGAKPKPR